jgi:hypothetical protein
MPQFEVALISFGKLIGFMNAGGVFQWTWFGDPLTNSFSGMATNREQIGLMLRALLDRDPGDSPLFDQADGLRWEALSPFTGAQVGVAWNEDKADPLQIGMGARAEIPISDQQLELLVLARMLRITSAGAVSSELGEIKFSGSFPVPDFLQAATLEGAYTGSLGLVLTASTQAESRALGFPTGALAWDVTRLATFVLRAWLTQQALQSPVGPPKNFFRRIDDHLFPMLGDPPGVIQPFPLLADPMGTQPSFDDWRGSILTTDENASGALTFLWHLRALVTGNTSPDVLGGSRWLPLIGGPEAAAGIPAPSVFPIVGAYPPASPSTGAWLGIRGAPSLPGTTELVVELRNGQPEPQGVRTIVLLQRSGPTFTRPQMPSGGAFADVMAFLAGITPLPVGNGEISFDAATGGLTLLKQTVANSGVSVLDGEYALELVLRDGEPVAYRARSPLLPMEFPPEPGLDPKDALIQLLQWVAGFVTGPEAVNVQPLVTALEATISSLVEGTGVDEAALFGSVAELIAENQTVAFGPASVGVSGGLVSPAVDFGPVMPEALAAQNLDYSIGKVKLAASLDLTANEPFQGFTISILDLRLGTGGGTTGSGLVANLIPDLRDMPGFTIKVGFQAPGTPIIEGGGKIPIQQTIGPLDVVALIVDLREDSLSVGIDLSFQLAVIKVSVYELGLRFFFTLPADWPPETPPVEVFLHGLGLSFDGGGIKLAGMFAEVAKPHGPSDYVGGAVVSIVKLFELSAIGAYTEINGKASLFIFASLVAPLGGPPWCFITGIAGGFGYNRTLPPSGLLTDHPFIKVMSGEIPIGSGDANALAKISDYFAPQEGTYWIAAGIQFTSFGLIDGKVVVAVQFGNSFSFHLLGVARFAIGPVAYFELGIEVTADEEKFLLKAGLSPNSYIIHPDIFSLQGDFGLGIWYADPNPGDFVLSIGGYHPYFPTPDHYPELARLAVKCTVYGFVRLSVEAFFACTPQALMAGVSVSLSAEFGGIGAGLDVYIDVYITWDPFYLQARMGVVVWFEFAGRHEVGVKLAIWTPEFGGRATIDLELVSFDVDFGADQAGPEPPRLDQFISRQLAAPAEQGAYVTAAKQYRAILPFFNTTEDEAGLFKLDIIRGRTTEKPSSSSKQEGLDANAPVPVNAEFAFVLRTKIPLNESNPETPPPLALTGFVDLPLCGMADLDSNLKLTANGFNDFAKAVRERTGDYYPAANFGTALDPAQADDSGARAAVAKMGAEPPAIPLTDGLVFNCDAIPADAPPDLASLGEEYSKTPAEDYPLPLGADQPLPAFRQPKSHAFFKNAVAPGKVKPRVIHTSSKTLAVAAIEGRTWEPLFVLEMTADLQRFQTGAVFKGLAYTVPAAVTPERPVVVTPIPAAGPRAADEQSREEPAPSEEGRDDVTTRQATAPTVIAVPASPRRRAELFPVNLRVAAPRSAIKLEQGRLESVRPARNPRRHSRTDARGTRENFSASMTVRVGQAVTLLLRGGRIRNQALEFTGTQTVRVIFQGGGEDLIGDMYITGPAKIPVPVRARRVTVIGEGMHAPIVSVAGAPIPAIREALGIEHDTTLLALGRRVFAGHGCVLVTHAALPLAARIHDSVPGFAALRGVTRASVHWPAAKGSLAMIVVPAGGGDPALALNEVRWAAMGGELRGLSTVVGASSVALMTDVTAPQPWCLEMDFGHKWRLGGIVLTQKSARDITSALRARTSWSLVDDRLQLAADRRVTTVTLQVTQ